MLHFGDEQIQTEYSALMSKVMADGQRQDQVPDQRAGRGQAEEPDRGVPRLLRRPGRAAHRDRDDEHRRHGRAAAGARRPLPGHAGHVLRRRAEDRVGEIDEDYDDLQRLGILADRDDDGLPAADLHEDGAGPADAVLRGDRAPRRARASATATSRRCSRRSSASRRSAATCRPTPLARLFALPPGPSALNPRFERNRRSSSRGDPRGCDDSCAAGPGDWPGP